ncbi:hypothetical protein WN944_014671 [Citrus x changshan-huyou]|uniref:Uncharacterized protein n=1 Tax=Citrus x changshan-huyou TaxID=2935761 RepID=A0AAP0MB07_9ROSI
MAAESWNLFVPLLEKWQMKAGEMASPSFNGGKYRSYLHGEEEKNTKWRFGSTPNYDVVDKLFEEGRTKVFLHAASPPLQGAKCNHHVSSSNSDLNRNPLRNFYQWRQTTPKHSLYSS